MSDRISTLGEVIEGEVFPALEKRLPPDLAAEWQLIFQRRLWRLYQDGYDIDEAGYLAAEEARRATEELGRRADGAA